MRLVPAIDLRDGRCVRLLQGRFDAETIYDEDPLRVLARYRELGARYVHVVDLDGARTGAQSNHAAIAKLASAWPDVVVQAGGGIRGRRVATDMLALGVRRIVVGSLAVTDPAEVHDWLRDFGVDRVVLAFDVRIDAHGIPRLATHGWESQTRANLWEVVAGYAARGAVHVLCTDVARDGALSGPNLALYTDAVARFPGLQWQASGGVGGRADLDEVARTGVAAIVSGRALLEGRIGREELEPFLPAA